MVVESPTIGIVGLGNMGQHHADNLRDRGYEVGGGVDVDEQARSAFEAEYGAPTFETPAALYDRGIDGVIVTTPNKFHEDAAVPAFEADVNVLLEKPVAHTVESAERIASAERDSDGFGMVGFHSRFLNPVQTIKAYDEAGTFGDITHIESNYLRRRGVPGRGSWFTRKELSGGGALIDIGVHALDLALYLLEYPTVEEVTGVTRSEFGGREDYTYLGMWGEDQGAEHFDVDDSVTAFVRTAEGTITLEVSWATNREQNATTHVRGTDAGATFDRHGDDLTLHSVGQEGTAHLIDSDVAFGDDDAHGKELERFVEAIAADEQPGISTLAEGLTVQRVIDAIYESSETGRSVRLDDHSAATDGEN
jgi:predicted dehydrogenase